MFNPFSTRPHVNNVVWYNNSWLGFQNSELCTKRKRKILAAPKISPHLSIVKCCIWLITNYFWQNLMNLLKLATYTKIEDHYSRCKLATFQIGKDCQILIVVAFLSGHKTSSFTASHVMNIKKFLLPSMMIPLRGSFPHGNLTSFNEGSSWLNGLSCMTLFVCVCVFYWNFSKWAQVTINKTSTKQLKACCLQLAPILIIPITRVLYKAWFPFRLWGPVQWNLLLNIRRLQN